MTYNHEKWVAQAIESVLMQQTDFDFEIILLEDCSTDGTRDIILDYVSRHPGRFKLMLAEQNRNSNVDWVRAMRNAQGAYVATLDGDDYWSSPHKLATQVSFMEQHPDCSLSYHNSVCVLESGSTFNHSPSDERAVSTFDDLLMANFLTTAGAMWSKRLADPLPDWLDDVIWGDWGLYLHAARYGAIRYIDEALAVYRIHSRGQWWGLSEVQKAEGIILFYEQMNANLRFEHDAVISRQIAALRASLVELQAPSSP